MYFITHSIGIRKVSRCSRILIAVILAFCASSVCRAEIDCIQFILPDGQTETVMLSSRPKLVLDSELISITYGDTNISIPLEDGLKIRYVDSQLTEVETVSSQRVYFSISELGIACHGLSSDEPVSLYSGNGTLLKVVMSDGQGDALISLPETGTYIIRAGQNSFKFLIR